MFIQKYMPEGYNQTICKNFDELLEAYKNNEKICAKALSLDINAGELKLQICEDNSVQGIIKFDEISFAENSLVGSIINCSFINEPIKGEVCEFSRNCSEAEDYCRKNYKSGDKLIGKVLTFLSYGTMVDIGGGFCILLPNPKVFNGIKHGTELFKKNDFINVVVNENSDDKFNIRVE